MAKALGQSGNQTKLNLNFPYHPAQRHIYFESAGLGRYRIFPKGRRLGATQGAAWACIEWMLEGKKILWGDTITANIRRYIERLFMPALKRHQIPHAWRKQANGLEVPPGYMDFRSADRPENWEGFGYDVIVLNEAGIILDDPYLWHNTVLPMMMDNPQSTLIAVGTPKMSTMTGQLFQDLWDRASAGDEGYYGQRYTTYDNPHLDHEAVRSIEADIAPPERPQEIEGRFIRPDELGSFFKRSDFTLLAEPREKVVRVCRGWDFAATEPSTANPDPDWTVGVKLGVQASGRPIILDCAMARTGPGGVDALLERMAKADGKDCAQVIPIDPGAAGKTAVAHFQQHPLKGFKVVTYPQTRSQGPKATRATGLSVAPSEGQIDMIEAPWNDWMFGQLTAFPNERVHDDAVDAAAAAYNELVGKPTRVTII